MKLLSIGTSGNNCTVSISDDVKVLAEFNVNTGTTHSENLMPIVDQVQKFSKIALEDLDAYAVSIGPGSFTGLRIGIATIKGLALGNPKPIIAVPTLLSFCYNIPNYEGLVISMIDAKNDNIYAGIYYKDNAGLPTMIGNYIADNVSVLISKIENIVAEDEFANTPILIIGEGSYAYKEILASKFANYNLVFAHPYHNHEFASSISRAGLEMAKLNNFVNEDELIPLYLKASQAERELEEKQGE